MPFGAFFNMRLIENYTPPTTDDMQNLKEKLGYTGNQMAEFCGLSNGNQWRKYTGGMSPRPMNQHILFFAAAQVALTDEEMKKVLTAMLDMGAKFNSDIV